MSESDKPRQKYVAIGYPVGAAFPTGIPETEGNVPPPDPPFTGKLTIIWDEEKQAMLERIQALEIEVTDLKTKLQKLLEAYRTYKEIPISEHPLYKKSD